MSVLKVDRIEGLEPGQPVQLEGARDLVLYSAPESQRPENAQPGTVWFNTTTQKVELRTASGWRSFPDLSAGSGYALTVQSPLRGNGSAAHPLDIDVAQFATVSQALTRVHTDTTLSGWGTFSSPLSVNVSNLNTSGGLTSVATDNTLLGAGTATSPLRLNLSVLRPSLGRLTQVQVTGSRSFAASDAGKQLLVTASGVTLLRQDPHVFQPGQWLWVTCLAPGFCTLEGIEDYSPLRLLNGESVLLISTASALWVAQPPSSLAGALPLRSSAAAQSPVEAFGYGDFWVVEGASAAATRTWPEGYASREVVEFANSLTASPALLTLQRSDSTVLLQLRRGEVGGIFPLEASPAGQVPFLYGFRHPLLFRDVLTVSTDRDLQASDAGTVLIPQGGERVLTLPNLHPFSPGDSLVLLGTADSHFQVVNASGQTLFSTLATITYVDRYFNNFANRPMEDYRQAYLRFSRIVLSNGASLALA
jgi:hypothetical protein